MAWQLLQPGRQRPEAACPICHIQSTSEMQHPTPLRRTPLMAALITASFGLLATFTPQPAAAQAAAASAARAPQPWVYQTRQLDRAAIDALLAQPTQLLVIDVRRPDELTKYGGFPVYLSVQAKDVEKYLPFIPKDRVILTVSNRAHRAGAVGDLLSSKGYQVAGAAGSEDYREQGGAVTKVAPQVAASASRVAPGASR